MLYDVLWLSIFVCTCLCQDIIWYPDINMYIMIRGYVSVESIYLYHDIQAYCLWRYMTVTVYDSFKLCRFVIMKQSIFKHIQCYHSIMICNVSWCGPMIQPDIPVYTSTQSWIFSSCTRPAGPAESRESAAATDLTLAQGCHKALKFKHNGV